MKGVIGCEDMRVLPVVSADNASLTCRDNKWMWGVGCVCVARYLCVKIGLGIS